MEKACPYVEYAFNILGKKWNGVIIHYLSQCEHNSSHFTELRTNIPHITPRALSAKLIELMREGLLEKKIVITTPLSVSYELTDKGRLLAAALTPIQDWAKEYIPI